MMKEFNAYPVGEEILKSLENEKKLIAPLGELVIQDKTDETIY